MPNQLITVAAELILMINCFAISLELLIAKKLAERVACFGVLTIGLAALFGSLRYTGIPVVEYHIWMSEIAAHFGLVAFLTLLAGQIKRDGFPLYLLLLVSMLGYAIQVNWLKDFAILSSLAIQAWVLYGKRIPAYHFIAAAVALISAGALSWYGFTPASWQEGLYYLLIALTIHQYFKQYIQRP